MVETWHCEDCGTGQEGQPEYIQTVPGYEGTIELWFCEDCTKDNLTP